MARRGETRDAMPRVRQRERFAGVQRVGEGGVTGIGIRRDVREIDGYDMAVLVSGDGDFRRPLELLRTRGKQFLVISTHGTFARELREVAGRHFVDLCDIRSCVEQNRTEAVLPHAS